MEVLEKWCFTSSNLSLFSKIGYFIHDDFIYLQQNCLKLSEINSWDIVSACVRAKSLQSCLTLCDPMDCSLPGSSVCGILQARILQSVALPST